MELVLGLAVIILIAHVPILGATIYVLTIVSGSGALARSIFAAWRTRVGALAS